MLPAIERKYTLYSFSRFVVLCTTGQILNSDGIGYYGDAHEVSDIMVDPDKLQFDSAPPQREFTLVYWMSNKEEEEE